MALSPGQEFAGYRIDGVIGQGGMGVVYRALQQRPRRTVALKVIAADLSADDQFRERFEREAELAASIEHPNIVPVYEVGEHAGQLFIAMRFVDGPDLATVLRDGPVSTERAAFIVDRLASALSAAHQAGLIHRDVKPANVLIRRSGDGEQHVYLTDFGLARRVEGSGGGLTGSGQFMGTPGYAAPEQIRSLPLDARTDVYALGCVLFELLTGERPFPRRDPTAVMYAHVNEPPPAPSRYNPELPSRVDDVTAMALAKRPESRFASTTALARAVNGALTAEREPSTSLCPECMSPVPIGASLCAHCGASALPPTGTQATLRLDGPTVPLHAAPRTVRDERDRPAAAVTRRRGLWLIPAAAAIAAAATVFIVLALSGQDPSTPTAEADGAPAKGSQSAPTATATTEAAGAPTATATAAAATATSDSNSTPTATATPAATTRRPRKRATAPVPEVPVQRTIAFQTGTDAGKPMPASYCRITSGQLVCWTPNDGYTLRMSATGAPIRARGEEAANKGRMPAGYDRLGSGSTRGRYGFRCTSRASGLSCQNTAGHGFTLPRYVGLPTLY